MALYKDKQYLNDSDHGAFDRLHRPGKAAPGSGIYRCEVCGAEAVCEKSTLLPPKTHHVHAKELGQIEWRLIVLVEPRGGIGVAGAGGTDPALSPGRELALEIEADEDAKA